MDRKRLKRCEVRGFRFVTFSCYKRQPLLGEAAWRDVFVGSLAAARARCGFRLVAWVVMPEHVHLVVVPMDEPVAVVLRAVKQPVAQRLLGGWRKAGSPVLDGLGVGAGRYRFWQAGGGFDRNVRDEDELQRAVAYIHHNPVARGLVERETDWAWSSARWYAGEPGQVEIDRVRW